jgi:hypothetical protein
MGTVRQRRFRVGTLVALSLLLAACASPPEPEADSSSGSEATTAVTAADGADGSDGADGVGTAGTGGAGGSTGSSGGGVDPDDNGGRVGSPLYIEAIQAFGRPGSDFVNAVRSNCEAVDAGSSCLPLTFEPSEKVDDENCSVSRTVPDVRYEEGKDKRIAVGTKVTVYLECPEPPEEGSGLEETTDPPEGDEG